MKKEQIIEAARKLFNKFGFKKVSMDEIAREAGVTKKTIYTYFESKEDLLKYFIEEEIKNMREIVEEVEKMNLEFFESVHLGIYKLLKYRKERKFIKIITEEAEWLRNPIIIQNLKLIDEHIREYIKLKLERSKEKGYIDYEDTEITTYLIYKMYIALMFEWDEGKNNKDEQMMAKSISKILKNGLRKEES